MRSCRPRITLWQRESCERRSCTRRFSEDGSSVCVLSLSAFQPLHLLTVAERETPVSSSSNSDDRRTRHALSCGTSFKQHMNVHHMQNIWDWETLHQTFGCVVYSGVTWSSACVRVAPVLLSLEQKSFSYSCLLFLQKSEALFWSCCIYIYIYI